MTLSVVDDPRLSMKSNSTPKEHWFVTYQFQIGDSITTRNVIHEGTIESLVIELTTKRDTSVITFLLQISPSTYIKLFKYLP